MSIFGKNFRQYLLLAQILLLIWVGAITVAQIGLSTGAHLEIRAQSRFCVCHG
jgi:hypothetical protein